VGPLAVVRLDGGSTRPWHRLAVPPWDSDSVKASRRSNVHPFAVMEIVAAANARVAAGHDVINLCVGEPASPAPTDVRRRAAELLATGDLGYTDPVGAIALREAIAEHYQRWYDVAVSPASVAVTTGSSGGFILAFLAAFDAGDRVAMARPGYPAYANILESLGCEVVQLDCGPATRYQPTVAQLDAIELPIDGLVVASPANPTGTAISPAELTALADWCAAHGTRLISDEIYHGITYDDDATTGIVPGAPTAANRLGDGAIVASSFSKYWAMTGWRLGWLLLPDDLITPVAGLAGNLALCPPSLAQHAATAAFTPASYAEAAATVRRHAEARALLLAASADIGFSVTSPADGGFYVYGNIAADGLSSDEWCARLLAEANVAATPGTDFDGVGGDAWVRLSFAAGPEAVAVAITRICQWRSANRR